MKERLETILKKYNELSKQLADPEVLSNYNKLKELSKEHKDLEEPVNKYKVLTKAEADLEDAKLMLTDDELKDMAAMEIESLNDLIQNTISELEILLIPKDENDGKNVVLEIRGAAGGDEANIFAGDLYRMYTYYAEKNKWKIEEINTLAGTSGGFSLVEVLIKGENVYSKLKFESGSHRVQRIPATETQGRVHTSTATVLVMPEVEELNMDIKENDLKIDVYRSSGAGGQSVNTTDSAVRITHLPTGTVVTCQNERSQIKNKEKALSLLKIRLHDDMIRQQDEAVGSVRKNKIGSGDRSEKIRTYNYPQNRVTDHRINFSVMNLDRVMDGAMDDIIQALITEDQRLKLEGSNE